MFTVTGKYLSNIVWKSANECLFDHTASASVWKIQVNDFIPSITHFFSLLLPYEMEKANCLKFEKDRNAYIIRKGMLRFLLSQYLGQNPLTIKFEKGQNYKPFILQKENSLNVFFNISYTNDLVVMAFANKEMGIDVEKVDTHFKYKELLSVVFSEEEINAINVSEDKLHCFYTLFTRKEALLKATGKGIINNLKNIPVLDRNRLIPENNEFGILHHWKMNSFELNGNYEASIAYHSNVEKIHFFDAKELQNNKRCNKYFDTVASAG